ncbi:MAG: prenyltransferase [Spirochaetales bacterium]|nr:prenyltransferase [Spirochaetales bacterium]
MSITYGEIKKWIKEFLVAMRIFSLTLALGATNIGILAAYRNGSMEDPGSWRTILLIALITIAGLASQAGANMINDFFEGSFKYKSPTTKLYRFIGQDRTVFDIFVFLSGLAFLGLAALIGIYLIYLTDWKMFLIGIIGIIGSYAYTGEPFVYKTRGLGVILSFFLMGPLMLLGAYYPFSGELSWDPIILGLPISLIVPAMMLSNEMRDFKRDTRLSMGTLSTIIGSRASLILFDILVFGSFLLSILYVILKIYPVQSLSIVLALPLAIKAHRLVSKFERLSIPWTNRLHLSYLCILSITLLFF